LTLSIGGPDGWTEGTAAVVASRIASQGKIVTIAAGNEVRATIVHSRMFTDARSIGSFWFLVYFFSWKRHQCHFHSQRGQVSSWKFFASIIILKSPSSTVVRLQNLTVTGVDYHPITYFATWPLPFDGTLPLYATSKDITVVNDACDPLPDSTPDLSKYITLIRRGSCNFVVKLANAAAKGAKIALIYE